MIHVPFQDLYQNYLSLEQEINAAIQSVIRSSAYIRGPFVEAFESQFANMLGIRHCISCGNGTDALYICMKGLKVAPGDEVITTAHSWISSSETISQAGANVVFCDTEKDSFLINPKLIEDKITRRTVGIIPVHLYGQPADMDMILHIANKHSLWVIEDCAQAHMATYRGKPVGTFGHAATFSFYPGKNLGAFGDAGCIVTQLPELATWCERYSRHGGKGEHYIEGINSRLDGIQAAILSVKMPYLKKWTQQRQLLAAEFRERLSILPDLIQPFCYPDRTHVYHLYVVKTLFREKLRKFLSSRNIATNINYSCALPFYPAYAHLRADPYEFPNAFSNASQILSLPFFPEITTEQKEWIFQSIFDFFDGVSQHEYEATGHFIRN